MCNITLVSDVLHSDLTFICITKWSPYQIYQSPIIIQSYYNIVDHIPYVVYYIPVAYLFYNWKFVPLNQLLQFCRIPHPTTLWQPLVYLFSVSERQIPYNLTYMWSLKIKIKKTKWKQTHRSFLFSHFGIHKVSVVGLFVVISFENFLEIISSKIVSIPFSLLFSRTPITHVFDFLTCPVCFLNTLLCLTYFVSPCFILGVSFWLISSSLISVLACLFYCWTNLLNS